MSDEKKQALEAEIRSYVGKPIGPVVIGRDPVNEPMIRQWCDAMGESHPADTEPTVTLPWKSLVADDRIRSFSGLLTTIVGANQTNAPISRPPITSSGLRDRFGRV